MTSQEPVGAIRLQDRFPYDPTLLALDGKFEPVGDFSFLINFNCVMVKNHIVKIGSSYFFFDNENKSVRGTAVKLVDVFYYLGRVYLLINDVFSGEVWLKSLPVENDLKTCPWKLVDTNSIETLMDAKEKKSTDSDLLEFKY